MIKVGDYIEIVNMKGEPLYTGRSGQVTQIDDMGQLQGTWGFLAVVPGKDVYVKIKEYTDDGSSTED